MSLFSIGHSTRSLDELVGLAKKWNVAMIADVRSFPGSRRYPHFNIERLKISLPENEIGYSHFKDLGGRRKDKDPNGDFGGWTEDSFRYYAAYAYNSDEFAAAFQSLISLSETKNVAMMCSEAVWWRCHRRIITDYAIANGINVNHILSLSKCDPAKITPFASIKIREGRMNNVLYPAQ